MNTIIKSFESATRLIRASNNALSTSHYSSKFEALPCTVDLDECLARIPISRCVDLSRNPDAFIPNCLEKNGAQSFYSSGYSEYSKKILLTSHDLEVHASYLSTLLVSGNVWDPSSRAIVVAPLKTNKVASFFADYLSPKLCSEIKLVDMFNIKELLLMLNTGHYSQVFMPVPVLIFLLEHIKKNKIDTNKWFLRHILTGGVVLPDSVRNRAKNALKATVCSLYGMSETGTIIACDGFCEMGLHFLAESYLGWELMSIEGSPYGEFVVTCLQREGTQIIRYATGDIMEDVSRYCKCQPAKKILKWIGRIDDMYPAGQMNLWWNGIMERHMYNIDGLKDYRILLKRNDNGLDQLIFKMVSASPITRDQLVERVIIKDEELYRQIMNGFIQLSIDLISQEEFNNNLFKPKRVVDLRT